MDPVDVALYGPEMAPRLQSFVQSHSLLLAPLAKSSRLALAPARCVPSSYCLSLPCDRLSLSLIVGAGLDVVVCVCSAAATVTAAPVVLPPVARFTLLPISAPSVKRAPKPETSKRVSVLARLSEVRVRPLDPTHPFLQ